MPSLYEQRIRCMVENTRWGELNTADREALCWILDAFEKVKAERNEANATAAKHARDYINLKERIRKGAQTLFDAIGKEG